MTSKNIKQIAKTDSPALMAILDYWKDYDTNTVLFAYGELKRRNDEIPDNLSKRIAAFCAKNNSSSIETLLHQLLKENGYSTFEELYSKEAETDHSKSASEMKDIPIPSADYTSSKRYPALRTISGLLKLFAILIVLAALFIAMMAFDAGDTGYTTAIMAVVLGGLMALFAFALAESIMVLIDIESNTRNKN